ncbi:hypothetical protein BD626DRAFT_540848 [Schizophyllum amplum]|uniref:Uncharacterized protein n=1 Tax=Schizophyllum amplum TaxID=97359 RepID=A0A550BWH8_9AGAR|nr:hypothetical protein BD626DRAFT_540848 [Auriculariopsis ampla]
MHEYNTPQALQLPVANKSRPAAVAKSVIVVRDGARDAARAATAGREQIEAARSSQAADRMRGRSDGRAPRLPVANRSRPAAAGRSGSAREREEARRRATRRAPPPRDCRSRTNRGRQPQRGRTMTARPPPQWSVSLGWCEAINGGDGGGGGGGDRWDPRAGEQAMAMATTGNGWWGKGARTSTGMSTARVKQKLLEADISEGAALVSNNNIQRTHSHLGEIGTCRICKTTRSNFTLFTPTAHADLGLSAFGTPLSNTNGVLYSPVAMDSPTITPASRGATTSLPGSPVGLLDAGGASPNEPGTEAPEGSRCPSPDETGTASSDGDDHSMSTLTDISDDEEEARAELAPSSSSGTPARPRISPSIGASGEDCETDLAAMRAPANSSAPERNNPSEPVAREKTMIECWWGPCHMAELLTMYERHLVPCQYPLSREEASRYPPGDMFVFAAGKQLDFFRTLPKSKYSSDVSWSVY